MGVYYKEKTTVLSEIRTRLIKVEGEHADQ